MVSQNLFRESLFNSTQNLHYTVLHKILPNTVKSRCWKAILIKTHRYTNKPTTPTVYSDSTIKWTMNLHLKHNNHWPFYGCGTRFLINCLHPILGRQKINARITHAINFVILSVPLFQSLSPQHLPYSLLVSALLLSSSVSPGIVTNFECGQRKIHTIEFSVGNLISFVVSGINITRAQPRPRIWPSALQLRLLLVFCWQQDNGKTHWGIQHTKLNKQWQDKNQTTVQETTDPTSKILRNLST